jgi:hypothetical protein
MFRRTTHLQEVLRGTLLLVAAIFLVPFFETVQARPEPLAAPAPCASGQRCVFLPMITGPVVSTDLVLSGIEVTQAIQDMQNSVPLVAGRPAILRIYTRVIGTMMPAANVKIQVTATRGGNRLSASPHLLSTTIPLDSSRAELNSTINIPLPADWLSGDVDLTVRLDPDNLIQEDDTTNNAITQRLKFNPVPPLKIKIVPIRYQDRVTNSIYPAPTTDTISDYIRRTYPVPYVELSWHAPYEFYGDLRKGDEFSRLLNEITALKASEGALPSEVYYALVPISNGSTSWWNGGIAGIGWVGMRASVGLNTSNSGQIAAHELGHNLGMSHTPCGSAAGTDPNYPFLDGSIGNFGLDVFTGTLYNPETAKDLMSYCNPKWISDYTYRVLYNAQAQLKPYETSPSFAPNQAESSSHRSLLFRANIIPDGRVDLLPTYILPGQAPALTEIGEYELQALDFNDNVLMKTFVRSYEKEVDGEDWEGVHAMISLPEQPVRKLRLLKDGVILAEQSVQVVTTDKLLGVQVEPVGDGFRLRWSEPERAALVRYTADGGKTYTTLSVDARDGEMLVHTSMLPESGGLFDVVLSDTWR